MTRLVVALLWIVLGVNAIAAGESQANAGSAVATVAELQFQIDAKAPIPGFTKARRYLDSLPGGDSIRLEVASDLGGLPNGDWRAGAVAWNGRHTSVIELNRAVLSSRWTPNWAVEGVDPLWALIVHEWAHVVDARTFGWTDSHVKIPPSMSELYAGGAGPIENHADCVAEAITGSTTGYLCGCTIDQLAAAVPLLEIDLEMEK